MPASGTGKWPGMIVGEAPGAHEDEAGEPFVGRAGRVLDRALHLATDLPAQIARKKLRVTNVVKCRPPENRNPSFMEIDRCWEFLEKEVREYSPVAILALGNIACEALLGVQGVTSLRGGAYQLDSEKDTLVYVTFHPAFVLRQGWDSDASDLFKKDVAEFVAKVRR